jgi:uroporphyrinogen III methyltransferase/synthase
MTARSLELIARADVVVHDRLIPDTALEGVRPDAELVYVGKTGGGESAQQAEIERIIVERARAGRSVVRLKGGDPFVFGRGGEEAQALRAAGVEFEVVPGVTAGVAATAYAGIPVTHRDAASAVAFVTGHEDPAKPESALDYAALSSFPGTLVFYMGVRRLPRIADELVARGRDEEEPAALIERGTMTGQRVVTATLSTIAAAGEEAGIRAPALAVFGPVAALREQLQWLERRPLAGRVVAVTRARMQASGLAARLRELGATVLETPAIRIEPLPVALEDVSAYDLVCVTSPNGARLLFERLRELGLDARALHRARVAAIGPGTARELRAHGIVADIVPERFVAESLVEALGGISVERALVARAAQARDVLPDALRSRGAHVDVVALYETVPEPLSEAELAAALSADYVTFTSSSTVTYFLDALGGRTPSERTRLVSIGPVTSATLRERGLEPHVEAARHDVDGLIDALVGDYTGGAAA